MTEAWERTTFGKVAQRRTETWTPGEPDAIYIGLEHISPYELRLLGAGVSSTVSSNKTRFLAHDVLFGKLRPYFQKVVRPSFPGVCSTDIWALYPADDAKVDPGFLHWVVADPAFSDFANSAETGTRMPRASWQWVSTYEVALPPLEEQRRIAEILGALDDRIDVLRRLQSLLQDEARARLALAFVDGADEVKLEDIAEVVMGNSPPGSSYNTEGTGTPLFQGCAEFGFRYPSERLYTTQPSRMAAANDTLVSVRAPVGKLNRASGACCIGRGLAAVRSQKYPSLTYYALDASEDVWDPYNSEGTVFGSINGGSLRGLNLTWPADPDVLEQQLRGIDNAITRFAVEETELASARAVLLPALVTGELRVAAAEELVEAAT